MRVTLEGDARVRTASAIAGTFGMDPVVVLAERNLLRRLVRLAAHNVHVREENRRYSP